MDSQKQSFGQESKWSHQLNSEWTIKCIWLSMTQWYCSGFRRQFLRVASSLYMRYHCTYFNIFYLCFAIYNEFCTCSKILLFDFNIAHKHVAVKDVCNTLSFSWGYNLKLLSGILHRRLGCEQWGGMCLFHFLTFSKDSKTIQILFRI